MSAGEQPTEQPRKPRGKLPKREPWHPAEYDIADAGAIQALLRGDAMPHQQQRALQFIIENLSGYYDLSFRPGADGDRATAFAEGMRHVGAQIVKLSRLNLAAMRAKDG